VLDATTLPLTRKSTRATPTLSLAVADSVVGPLTDAPSAGAVSATVGAVVSVGGGGGGTVPVIAWPAVMTTSRPAVCSLRSQSKNAAKTGAGML